MSIQKTIIKPPVQQFIDEISIPKNKKKTDSEIFQEYSQIFKQSSEFLSKLEIIYIERKKYSLGWAFENANNMVIDKLEKAKSVRYDLVENSQSQISSEEVSRVFRTDISQTANRFKRLYRITQFLEILVSIILIVRVTLFAQTIERPLNSIIFTPIFIVIIALTKVLVDRFYMKPRIDRWGWDQYHNVIHIIERKIFHIFTIKLALRSSDNGVPSPRKVNELYRSVEHIIQIDC